MSNRTKEPLRPVNRPVQNNKSSQGVSVKSGMPQKNEVPVSVIVIKALLAILSITAAILFASFIIYDYTFEYIHTALPVAMQTCDDSPVCEPSDEADIPTEPEIYVPVYYDFAAVVPERDAVDFEYFNDTVFIGDSRTKGLLTYTKLTPFDFSSVGLNVSSLQTKAYIRMPDENGDPISLTLFEALEREKENYKSIYIATGLNELGWSASGFIRSFGQLIDSIHAITDVPIYVQLIIPVTTASSESTQFGITNEKCIEFNEKLTSFIIERELFMLDPRSLFILEDGTLDPAHSSDGIHLNMGSCGILADYYRTHTVDINDYDNTRPVIDAEAKDTAVTEQ